MAGKVIREYLVPGGYHHDCWEMENGDLLLILSESPSYETVEDEIVLIDRANGQVKKVWDLNTA